MNEDAVAQLAEEYARLGPQLNERERRLWAGRDAKALVFNWTGHDGTTDQTSSPPRTGSGSVYETERLLPFNYLRA